MAFVTREALISPSERSDQSLIHRGPGLLITNVIMSIIVGLIVILRLYTRLFVQRWFGSDDVLIIISLVVSIAVTVVLIASRNCGWDLHFVDIPSSRVQETLIFGFVLRILFGLACTCIRASFLCLYQRLLRTTSISWYKYSLLAIWAYVLGLEMVSLVIEIFGCHPVRAYWAIPTRISSCWDEGVTYTTLGAFHCLCDFIITVWPIPIIFKLQMPKKSRYYTVAFLNMGFTVTIAGCLRTYYIWAANASGDITWSSYPLWLASGFEIYLGMIFACALALRPLFTRTSEPARSAFNPRGNARLSDFRVPIHHPSGSSEMFSDRGLSTSQIKGGTPVRLDEESSDTRDRAAINGILVRTRIEVGGEFSLA